MISVIGGLYARIFSRGIFVKINTLLLSFALRARGYNNFRNNKESGESFFINEILAPTNPKLCIDIGANIGEYTIKLLEETSARIISFEPLPAVFQQLTDATKNYAERVILENKGIGSIEDMLTLHYNPKAVAHASFSEEVKKVSYVSNKEKIECPVIKLDSYCEANNITTIDLVKIDTEGFESEVFEGAINTFSKIKPKFIHIEFNWHQLFRNTSLNYFAEQLPEYDVYQLVHSGWVKRDAKDPLTNIFHFSNFIFVRIDK